MTETKTAPKPTELVAVEVMEPTALRAITQAEIDIQISTAKAFPRSISAFKSRSLTLIREDEQLAADCSYAVPRGKKIIRGPSIRLAEIVMSGWGNLRVKAELIEVAATTLTVRGMAWDLETNVAVSKDSKRRITYNDGRRYSEDMIVMTGNAAASIAIRNAIFTVVPKTFVNALEEEARAITRGDERTLPQRRSEAVAYLKDEYGVGPERICAALTVKGIDDIDLDKLVQLKGMCVAIKDGDANADEQFPAPGQEKNGNGKKGAAGLAERLGTGKPTEFALSGESERKVTKAHRDKLLKLAEGANVDADGLAKLIEEVGGGKTTLAKIATDVYEKVWIRLTEILDAIDAK